MSQNSSAAEYFQTTSLDVAQTAMSHKLKSGILLIRLESPRSDLTHFDQTSQHLLRRSGFFFCCFLIVDSTSSYAYVFDVEHMTYSVKCLLSFAQIAGKRKNYANFFSDVKDIS